MFRCRMLPATFQRMAVVTRSYFGLYRKFEAVLGTVTTEKDRPSFMNHTIAAVAQEQQVSKFIK